MNKGFNLIEFCCCLLLLCIMLLVAIPSWRHWVKQQAMVSDIYSLMNLINYAKITAIAKRNRISLCRSLDHVHCSLHWQGDFIVFIDEARLGKVQHSHDLLRVWSDSQQASIYWSNPRRFISLHPSGINTGMAGAFYYCPHNQDRNFARGIVINIIGRVRIIASKDMPKSACG